MNVLCLVLAIRIAPDHKAIFCSSNPGNDRSSIALIYPVFDQAHAWKLSDDAAGLIRGTIIDDDDIRIPESGFVGQGFQGDRDALLLVIRRDDYPQFRDPVVGFICHMSESLSTS